MKAFLLAALLSSRLWAQSEVYAGNAASGRITDFAAGGLVYVENLTSFYPPPNTVVSVRFSPNSAASPMDLPSMGSGPNGSVLVQIPKTTPLGVAQIEEFFNGVSQGVLDLNIVASSFGLFTNGPVAMAQNVAASGAVVTNSLTHPARPKTLLTLWGTGLGSASLGQVSILVGGRPAPAISLSSSTDSPGLDQINIQIPDDPAVPEGCYVAVDITVAGVLANRGSISYSRSGASTCKHPLGLTVDQLQTLDTGGTVTLATLRTYSVIDQSIDATGFTRDDEAAMRWNPLEAIDVAYLSGPAQVTDDALFGCSTAGDRDAYGVFSVRAILSGDLLAFTGPDGRSMPIHFKSSEYDSLPATPGVPLEAVPDSFFLPGTWTLTRPPGRGIIPFTIKVPMPPAIRISNPTALATLDRHQDAIVQWDPQGFTANQTVRVTPYSYAGQPYQISSFSCVAPATSGTLTIPQSFVAGLPATTAADARPPYLQVQATTRLGFFSTFQIPAAYGTTILGGFNPSSSEYILTKIQ